MERTTIFNGKSTNSMVIFNSYVKLPEGRNYDNMGLVAEIEDCGLAMNTNCFQSAIFGEPKGEMGMGSKVT